LTLIPIYEPEQKLREIERDDKGKIWFQVFTSDDEKNFFTRDSEDVYTASGVRITETYGEISIHKKNASDENQSLLFWYTGDDVETWFSATASVQDSDYEKIIELLGRGIRFNIILKYNDDALKKRDTFGLTFDDSESESIEIIGLSINQAGDLPEISIKLLYKRLNIKDPEDKIKIPSESQKSRYWEVIRGQAAIYAYGNGLSFGWYEAEIDKARWFIDYLQFSLNPFFEWNKDYKHRIINESSEYFNYLLDHEKREDPTGVLWRRRDLSSYISSGRRKGSYWPVDRDAIEEQLQEYIAMPWLYCASFDRIFVTSLIYIEFLAFYEDIKSFMTGRVYLKYSSGNKEFGLDTPSWNSILWKSTKEIILILAIGVAGFGVADAHGAALGVIASYLLYAAHNINLKSKEKEKEERVRSISKTLASMKTCYKLSCESLISPTYLRDYLLQSESEGIVWPSSIFTILELAIKRNSSVWE
jgi:hypothetical protein